MRRPTFSICSTRPTSFFGVVIGGVVKVRVVVVVGEVVVVVVVVEVAVVETVPEIMG